MCRRRNAGGSCVHRMVRLGEKVGRRDERQDRSYEMVDSVCD